MIKPSFFTSSNELSISLVIKELITDIGLCADFSLPCGGISLLLGANGSGKSTLLKTILGLRQAQSGLIQIEMSREEKKLESDIDISSVHKSTYISLMNNSSLRAKYLAYVPQSFGVGLNMTVEETLVLGGRRFLWMKKDQSNLLEEVLAITKLSTLKKRVVSTLSGGETALVNLARALMQNTPYLLIDEGDAALDIGRRTEFYAIIQSLASKGRGILMVTHNPEAVLRCIQPYEILLTMPSKVVRRVIPKALSSELLSEAYGSTLSYAGVQGRHVIV